MNLRLIDVQREIEQKTAQLHEMAQKAATAEKNAQGGTVYNWTAEQLGEFKARNAELEDLNKQAADLQAAEAAIREMERKSNAPVPSVPTLGRNADEPKEQKTLGRLFVEHKGFKDARNRMECGADLPDVDIKTLMSTSAGFAPANPRTNVVVLSAQRRPVVADMIPQDPTTLSAIKYMEETTFTNNAATAAEGAQFGESALAFTERTALVQKIAAFLPVTDEQTDDVPGIEALINNRLALQLALTEEVQLLTGDGVTPNLVGFASASGLQTQARGADTVWDAVFKAMSLIRWTGFAEPSAVIMHPNDWAVVRLATTADGLYIWGLPSLQGVDTLWGKPVVVTPAQTENTALVGDFLMYSHISRKQGVQIDISNSHSDYFIKGKAAIRITERLSLEIYRGAAFCTVTGI